MKPQRGVDDTAPTSVRRAQAEPNPAGGSMQPPPVKPAKPARPRRWPWVLLGLFLVILLGGVGSWIGYSSAIQLRQARLSEQRVSIATQYFMSGLVAQQNKQYEVARLQFEEVIRVDPTFPGAQDKLREVLIEMAVVSTPTPAPTAVTPTLQPTPDTRPLEQIFAQARQLFVAKDWDALFMTIDALRRADPKYRAVEVDGMLYTAFRFRGIDKIIHQANLEGGLYDLALAERFAPLDVDSLGYRNWARLYLNGASFWEVDWVRVMETFEQIYPYFPNMRDSSGITAIERYRLAARGQGDKLFASENYCEAYEFYNKSLQAGPDGSVEQKAADAYNLCHPPTPTPAPEQPTPEPSPTENGNGGEVPPTDTPEPTPEPTTG
jgi:tetratricopeptide (TPR) repeat protein